MSDPATSHPAGFPQPDRDAVLAVLQEQLDDLLASSKDQQAAIEALDARMSELEQHPEPPADGP